jgi:hypothetical protein
MIIMGLAMAVPTYRRPPRGRPQLGFQLETPPQIALQDGAVLCCREVLQDGRRIGELEVSVFAAALVIDRDGTLARKACDELEREAQLAHGATAVPVQLPGACGFRAEAVQRAPLPYLYVFAMAPPHAIDGGVLVIVRSVQRDWPAADHMLRTLRILTRTGVAPANEDAEAPICSVIGLPGTPRD